MKDRCPLERLWLSSWGQLAARLAAAPPGAAAAPGPAASRDASAQVLCGFGARRPPSWTPARPQGQDDVMTAMRPMVRWALPGGLVAVVVATIALGPLVQAGAAGDVPEPGAGELLADLLGAGPQGLSGTVVTRVDLGLPLLPAGLGGAAEGSWAALLTGDSTLRVWAGPAGVRVALLGVLAESDLVISDADAWLWSSPDGTVTHLGTSNRSGGDGGIDEGADPSGGGASSDLLSALAALAGSSTVSTGENDVVAGRAVHQLVLAPSEPGSLIGSVRVAIDAEQGVPTRLQVFAAGDPGRPALEIGFSEVAFSEPDPAIFTFAPPADATVREGLGQDPAGASDGAAASGVGDAPVAVIGEGWTTVVVTQAPAQLTDGGDNQGSLAQLLALMPQVSGSWGSGRLLTTRLFSVLLTDDGRLFAGAVDGERLQQVAADQAAQGQAAQP